MRPRIIPLLLLDGERLVKTVRFRKPKYVGDPVNAVRIFNEKEADELIVLDISATRRGLKPNFELLKRIAGEAFMPVAYGGAITNYEDAKRILRLGVEKIVVNTAAHTTPDLVSELSTKLGSQSVIVSIDAKRRLLGGYSVYVRGRHNGRDPVFFAKASVTAGAGEIMINSIDRDGTMEGYDLALIESISKEVDVPVIAAGGAGKVDDLVAATHDAGASAAAAGSLFVFYGPRRAVLITFPTQHEIAQAFNAARELVDT